MASAAALVLLAMGLAGCSGLDNSDAETLSRNQGPTAQLEASEGSAWTGESVTFDAAGSSDPDGEIVSYRFDFGDDTPPVERDGATSDGEPSISHAYLRGGEYVVTLTVTDDGGNETGALTDTDTVRVTINEEFEVSELVQQTPVNGTEDRELPFDVNAGADRFELEVEVQNNAIFASSEIKVEVLGPDNETLDSDTVTVSEDQSETVSLDGLLTESGAHAVRVTAMSGGATVTGTLQVLYGPTDE